MNKWRDSDDWRAADQAAEQYGKWCEEQRIKAQHAAEVGDIESMDAHYRRSDYFLDEEHKAVRKMEHINDYRIHRESTSFWYRIGCANAIAFGLAGAAGIFEVIRTILPMLFRRRR